MRVFRGRLPLLCSLLAIVGAARAACAPCWLQPACRRIAIQWTASEPLSASARTSMLSVPARGLTTIKTPMSNPRCNPSGFSSAETTVAPINFAINSCASGESVRPVIISMDRMVAEQHPTFTPTAARRTAGKPGSRVYPNNQEAL